MANMSYCRFQNTLQDLRDCVEAMDDAALSDDEAEARERLLLLVGELAADYEDEIEAIEERKAQRRRAVGEVAL